MAGIACHWYVQHLFSAFAMYIFEDLKLLGFKSRNIHLALSKPSPALRMSRRTLN